MSGICATPGCTDSAYKDSNGKVGKYCRKTHKYWGERGCILCRRTGMFGDSKFCYTCNSATKNIGPVLVPISDDHETYRNVANQFQKSWRHPSSCPKVQAIYKIVECRSVSERYDAYRNEVEKRGGFTSQGLTAGNQRRRWHGTNRECNLGDNGRTSFCYSPQCSLCCIIRTSFDLSHSKKNTGGARYGRGIYTSSTSSNSNGYSRNLTTSPWKAVLLVYVTVGKTKKVTTDQPTLTQPPTGFDSLVGHPGGACADELVVYTNDAVCPAYLVMYDS